MKALLMSLPFLHVLFIFPLFSSIAYAAHFEIRNNCPFTVWAASVPTGGGRQLNAGQTWNIDVPAGTKGARVWARTGCNFDGSGRGRCQTGDCNGLLNCQGYGSPPYTLAEYELNGYQNLDIFDISLVDGFNVPMEFSPTSNGCTSHKICRAVINGQCAGQLRAPEAVCPGGTNYRVVFCP